MNIDSMGNLNAKKSRIAMYAFYPNLFVANIRGIILRYFCIKIVISIGIKIKLFMLSLAV